MADQEKLVNAIFAAVDELNLTRPTEALAHNASGDTVQSALRQIPGLEEITVSTSTLSGKWRSWRPPA